MKKVLLTIVGMMMFGSLQAQASPLWTCIMHFEMEGKGFQVLIGEFNITGEGAIDCISITGETSSTPIAVNIGATPLALRVAIGKFKASVISAEVGLTTGGPDSLLGDYHIAVGEGAILGGVGAFTGVHVNDESLFVVLGVEFLRGLGVNIGIEKMTLTAL